MLPSGSTASLKRPPTRWLLFCASRETKLVVIATWFCKRSVSAWSTVPSRDLPPHDLGAGSEKERTAPRKSPAHGPSPLMEAAVSRACAVRGVLLQQLAGHDHALDLVGARVDLRNLGIAHPALQREVLDVPGTTQQLDGVGGDLHGRVGGVALGGGAVERQIVVVTLGLGSGHVHHLAGGLQLHGHVGEHELDTLEVGDGLTELLAFLDVGHTLVQGALSDADGLRADGHAGVVEGAQRDLETLTGGADHTVPGDAHIVEEQFTRGGALDT